MGFLKIFDSNLYGRDFVVSDLHGCYNDFQEELRRFNFDPEIDRVFSVGDLPDRGPDCVACLSLLKEEWFHAVKGNHEIMWLAAHKFWHKDFDKKTENENDLKTMCHIFLQNGGKILDDYSHYLIFKKLIEELPSIIEVNHRNGKKFGILHAELPVKFTDWNVLYQMSDDEMEKTMGESLYWGRNRIMSKNSIHNSIENVDRIYVGHTIVHYVIELGNIRYIDTGSFLMDGNITLEVMK